MATQVASYPNSGTVSSENLSPAAIAELVRYSALPDGARALILASLHIAPQGRNQAWSSVDSLAFETRKSPRTVQYHRRRLRIALGVAHVARSANTWDACPKCRAPRDHNKCSQCGYFCDHSAHKDRGCPQFRRGATYEYDLAKIASFQPCPAVRQFRNHKEYRASYLKKAKQRQPAPQPAPPPTAHAQPVPIRPAVQKTEHRNSTREPNRRERAELAAKVALVRQFRDGHTRYFSKADGFHIQLSRDDPRYRAPLPFDDAVREACMTDPVMPEKKLREFIRSLPKSLEEEEGKTS